MSYLPFLNDLTLNVSKVPDYPEFKKKFVERIDKPISKLILKSNNGKLKPEVKNAFQTIVDSIGKNQLNTTWFQKNNLGRMYPKSGLSLTPMCKYVKHTIYSFMGYNDLDMVKGHCSIAVEVNKKLKKPMNLSWVNYYINNFDFICEECIKLWSLDDKVNRLDADDIKQLFNLTIYGGTFQTWVDDLSKEDLKSSNRPKKIKNVDATIDAYQDFEEQIRAFNQAIYNANSEMDKLLNKPVKGKLKPLRKRQGTVLSYFYDTIENHILYECFLYLVKEGIIEYDKKKQRYFATPEFDGICIPAYSEFDKISSANEINANIKEKTGLEVKMKWKAYGNYVMQDIIDQRSSNEEEEAEEAEEATEKIVNDLTSEPDYLKKKAEFEKNVCKILNIPAYCVYLTNEDGEASYHLKSRADIAAMFEHWSFKTKEGKKVKFITNWFCDENLLLYDTCNTYPVAEKCPKNVKNIYIPFIWENDTKPYNESKEGLQFWLNHLKILCNHEQDIFNYLLLWIAHIVQFVQNKSGKMLIFISEEGGGKGSFIKFIQFLLGTCKVLDTDKPDVDVYGQFNMAMKDVVVVFLDDILEAKGKNDLSEEMKKTITDPTIRVSDKYEKRFVCKSYHRFVLCGNPNQQSLITISDKGRRYLAIRCSDELTNPDSKDEKKNAYFIKLHNEMFSRDIMMTCYHYFKKLSVVENFSSIPMPKSDFHLQREEQNKNWIDYFMEYFTLTYSQSGEKPKGYFTHKKTKKDVSYESLFHKEDGDNEILILRVFPDDIYNCFQQWANETDNRRYVDEYKIDRKSLLNKIQNTFTTSVRAGKHCKTADEKVFNLTALKKQFYITDDDVEADDLFWQNVYENVDDDEHRLLENVYESFERLTLYGRWIGGKIEGLDFEEMIAEVEEEEEEEEQEEEEEEQEFIEVVIGGIGYYATNETNSDIYKILPDYELGEKVGVYIDGKPTLFSQR